jgi:two-component system sensor histidine kinase PilS (NtrC family)
LNATDRGTRNERRTLRWLLGGRVAAAIVLLASATFGRLRAPEVFGPDSLFLLLAITFALTVVHAVSLRVAPRSRWLTDAQLAADAAVVSAAVLLTGGYDSLLVPLYVLPVVGAAVVQDRRAGLLVATLNTILYATIIALQYDAMGFAQVARLPGLVRVSMPPVPNAVLTIALNGAGFASVAWLTGYLSERLRHTDERLRQASNLIADLQAFNHCIIDSLTGGLATASPAGDVLTFNRAAEQITGVTAAEVVGRPVREVLQLPGDLVRDLPQLVDNGAGYRIEVPYRTASGRQLDLGLTAAPLMGAAEQVGFLFTFQDITEWNRREREIQTERRLAAIGEMAAGIAHEIRNPLASMAGSIQVLRNDLELSADQARLMDIVVRESQRLNDTISHFLAYARPGRLALKPVDLRRIVEDAASLLENSSERHPAHQVLVAGTTEPCFVRADEGQLRQVIWNLVTNGLKAMPKGGRLELSIEHAAADRVAVVVRDEGIGMTAADLDHVFEPFRSTFPGGTGLGLSIVHRIVSDAGGSIDVQSLPGSGTAVRVTFPAAVIDAATPRALSA